MKKKIAIHTILVLLITTVFILGFHFSYYYPDLPVRSFVFNIPEWEFFFKVMGLIFIISFVSQYIGKKFNIRLLKHTSIILFSIFLMFLIAIFVTEYLLSKKDYNEELAEYVNKAKEEIENDKVMIGCFGLFEWIKEGKQNTVDSISNKYGVQLILVDTSPISHCRERAKEKYYEIVDAHLIERNGDDWRQRMDAELEPYIGRLIVEQ